MPTKIRIFICFDEDDENEHNVDFNNIFSHEGTLPFSVEVAVLSHNNCMEMMLDAIDKFNARLTAPGNKSTFTLEDDQSKIKSNYCLYLVDEDGLPDFDVPCKYFR